MKQKTGLKKIMKSFFFLELLSFLFILSGCVRDVQLVKDAYRGQLAATSEHVFYAVKHKDTDILKHVLNLDSSLIYKKNDNGHTLFNYALRQGNIPAMKVILEINPYMINKKDEKGRTPIFYAPNRKVANFLMFRDVELDICDNHDIALIEAVVFDGKIDVMRLLIDNGIDIQHKNLNGWTLLHQAAFGGHPEMVAFFLSRGLDINAPDIGGNRPLDLAYRKDLWMKRDRKSLKQRKLVIQILRKHGALLKTEAANQN